MSAILDSHNHIVIADIGLDTLLASSQCCRFLALGYLTLQGANITDE
jgi:hypothetical protein